MQQLAWTDRVQVLKVGVLDRFKADLDIAVFVGFLGRWHQLVKEVSVFEQSGHAVKLSIGEGVNDQSGHPVCVLHAHSADAGLVVPLVQAVDAVKKLFLAREGSGLGVKCKFHGSPDRSQMRAIVRELRFV